MEWQELEFLLLQNEYRVKTIEQKVREGLIFEVVEKEKAKERQIRKPINSVVPNLAHRDEQGKSREIVAEKIGLKRTTFEDSKKVLVYADSKPKEQKEFITSVLNNISTNAAKQVIEQKLDEKLAPEIQELVIEKEVKISELSRISNIILCYANKLRIKC